MKVVSDLEILYQCTGIRFLILKRDVYSGEDAGYQIGITPVEDITGVKKDFWIWYQSRGVLPVKNARHLVLDVIGAYLVWIEDNYSECIDGIMNQLNIGNDVDRLQTIDVVIDGQ